MALATQARTRALTPAPTASVVSLATATDRFALNAKSAMTQRCYRSDWLAFTAWCRKAPLTPLPATPETVAQYLSQCALDGLSASTIGRKVAAISYAHRLKRLESPCRDERVRTVVAGIRRSVGTAPRRKQAITAERLTLMLAGLPDTLAGKRDRALLCLGFAGAFRRSELCALEVADLTETPDGLRILIRRSKTDQEGQGQEIAIPRGFRLRPVEAVQGWLAAAVITEGAIFRRITTRRLDGRGKPATELVGAEALCAHSVAHVVKRHCRRVGLDVTEFSAHSLRSGYVTSAVEANAPIMKIAEQTRHRSLDMLRVYSRRVDLFREHSGAAFL
jgi:integrase